MRRGGGGGFFEVLCVRLASQPPCNTLVTTSVCFPTIPREAEIQVTDCDQKACLCKQKYLYNTSMPKNTTDTQTFIYSHDLR